MHTTTVSLLTLALLTTLVAGCGPKTAAEPEFAPRPSTAAPQPDPVLTWKAFQDPAQRFTIELPGEPAVNTSTRKVAAGSATEQSFLVDLGGRTFGVAITVFPPEFMKDALEGQILGAARKAAVAEIDGTVREDTPVTMTAPDGVALPGRHVVVESESMNMVSRNHWLLDRGTLYRLMQSGPTDSTRAADFEHMVKSFTLVPVAPAP